MSAPPTTAFREGAAVVIGGSGGVGVAICGALAQAGSKVALTYRNNDTQARVAAEAVRRAGRDSSVTQLSLDDRAAIHSFFEATVERFGAIHSVVYAAGPDIPMLFVSEVSGERWREVMDADANGFFNLVQAALPWLRADGGGSLVAITTAGLRRYPPRDVLSVAPKAAVEAVVRALAREEGRYGVRANSVALGVIDAGIFRRTVAREGFSDAWVEAARKNTALNRFGLPEEVGEAVVFLASERSSYITGQTLMLDGGYSL